MYEAVGVGVGLFTTALILTVCVIAMITSTRGRK